ncbi:Nn.00g005730.m01.CDS01 [Neocucurbitaria sp. VM-36]
MNYASWIEEKKLKKTFIVATLASTLVGTFTASMGLWERVADRREQHRQRQRDTKQDGEIKKLREEFEKTQKSSDAQQHELDRSRNGGGGGNGGNGGGGGGGGQRDDVGRNLERDSIMIQRMYDDMYSRNGRTFAQGDAIVENQLQAQIISLQQTVINVLQDALYNDRQLTRADMAKLIAASNSAREGSLDALRQAQQRLGSNGSNRSPSPQRSLATPKRASTIIMDNGPNQLFCRYSLDLQYVPHKPLAASFAPGGSCQCPACGVRLDITAEDFWMIGKRTPLTVIDNGFETDIMETREFRLGQRFVLKCHTPDGEYACTICNKNRDVDAICRNVESLVKHVGTYHDVDELDREVDLRETKVDTRRLSLPAPRAPSPPPVAGLRREEVDVREYR